MNRLVLLTVALAIAGCSAVSETHEKKGRKGLHINCSGLTSGWGRCEQEATKACGDKGYKVIARSGGDSSDEDEDEGFLLGINPAGFSSRSMIVICR
jgi:hypothetical protein